MWANVYICLINIIKENVTGDPHNLMSAGTWNQLGLNLKRKDLMNLMSIVRLLNANVMVLMVILIIRYVLQVLILLLNNAFQFIILTESRNVIGAHGQTQNAEPCIQTGNQNKAKKDQKTSANALQQMKKIQVFAKIMASLYLNAWNIE